MKVKMPEMVDFPDDSPVLDVFAALRTLGLELKWSKRDGLYAQPLCDPAAWVDPVPPCADRGD